MSHLEMDDFDSPLLDPDYPRNRRPILCRCAMCGDFLRAGDKVIESGKGTLCEDCVYGLSTDELFDLVGKEWEYLVDEEEEEPDDETDQGMVV